MEGDESYNKGICEQLSNMSIEQSPAPAAHRPTLTYSDTKSSIVGYLDGFCQGLTNIKRI